MKILLIIFLIFGFFFTKIAYSENLYLYGGLGFSDYSINSKDENEIDNKLINLGFASSSTSTSSEHLLYKFGLGFKTPLKFSIEASYINYGKVSFASETAGPTETMAADVKIQGLNLDIQKNFGPFGISAGFIRVNDNIEVASSKGNIDVPVDDILIPKIGTNIKINNYRFELNRVFLTTNSQINSFIISYIFNLF